MIDFHQHKLAALFCVILFAVSVHGDSFDDYAWMKPGDNVEDDQVYILISPEIASLDASIIDGIAWTGIGSLDAVADAFGVYNIEKLYPSSQPPKDPDKVDLSRYYVAYFPQDFGLTNVLDAYNRCSELEFAEWVLIFKTTFMPNDPRYQTQWHLEHCGFEAAWEYAQGSDDVVIGIVDSGIDMPMIEGELEIHEDLAENLWVNPGEDLNGDGEVDWGEWNGRDDDQNGKTDDFWGWDFEGQDNHPDDPWGRENGHGTHVAGIVSAATNNETGVASAGFSCKLMVMGCYSERSPDDIAHGYEGIQYCAANGADVINMSWGILSPYSRALHDVIRYADGEGAAMFAGAGNDYSIDRREDRSHFYPCAFDEVIGVGATDRNDEKADFSNWGDFTDLVAPGVNIISTFPHNSYLSTQGTSMSSPFAAGLGALILSILPDLTPAELLARMQEFSTDVSDINADYPGIVYRINADLAINTAHPQFDVLEWSLRELDGDGNRYLEPGEQFTIDLSIQNRERYTDAHNVVVRLANQSPHVTINRIGGRIGHLNNGDQIDVPDNLTPIFTVNESAPHYSNFDIIITSDEGWQNTLELPMTLGHPEYMLIDDDGGDQFEMFYGDDLDRRPVIHTLWSIIEEGLPSQDEINSFPLAIWITGNAEDPLSEADQGIIRGYLDNGGKLVISGQFIGDDHGDTEFHRQYLHANHLEDDIGESLLSGVDGNPISDGVSMILVGGGAAGNGRISPSSMEPINGASTLLTYNADGNPVAGIFYEGDDYTLVYLGFALEAVSGAGRTTKRHEFMARMIENIHPVSVDEMINPASIPDDFTLDPPWPNPFNSQATVRLTVPNNEPFLLDVIDLNGRLVSTLFEGKSTPGAHTYTLNANDIPAGIYFFRLSWQQGSTARKVVMVK